MMKPKTKYKFHKWFAWYPVRVDDKTRLFIQNWVWLEVVLKRFCSYYNDYEYKRLKQNRG